jgi:hypothetical protein
LAVASLVAVSLVDLSPHQEVPASVEHSVDNSLANQ